MGASTHPTACFLYFHNFLDLTKKYDYMKIWLKIGKENVMPTIEVTERDFIRLQSHAEPLVDTATTTITKILDMIEKEPSKPGTYQAVSVPENVQQKNSFRPGSIPPLKHTKFMAGAFAEQYPDKNTWDAMVRLALVSVFENCHDIKIVRGSTGANIVNGEKTDEGYKYMPEVNFSYQGVSAEDAIEIVVRAARSLNVDVWVDFVWRDKPDAYRPGEAGRIKI